MPSRTPIPIEAVPSDSASGYPEPFRSRMGDGAWRGVGDHGELCLRTEDGEHPLTPGMCIGFKAGDRNAHHLVNRSQAAARFLVVGSRVPGDVPFYPDDDLAVLATPEGRAWVHKDGSRYNQQDGDA